MVAEAVPATVSTVGIPHLPPHLQWVPAAPDSGHDPDGDEKRAAWRQWAFEVRRYRLKREDACENDPVEQAKELKRCENSPAYFLTMWANIYEPRHEPEFGIIGGVKPWIPFSVQVEFIDWLEARMARGDAERDGIVSKSRDMGATWTACCWLVHGWLFKFPWNVLLMSRNQSLVDSKSDDSMFAKIEMVIDNLPPWMKPEGFDLADKTLNSELMLINPATKAQIKGESTNRNAGRSGRYTVIVVDEAAFVEHMSDIWGGLAATTYHRIAISSESLSQGPDFFNLGINNKNPKGRKPALFEMNWWDHPMHDYAWLQNTKDVFEGNNQLDKFYQEYLRDARSGNTQAVYPQSIDITPDATVQYVDMGLLYASIDPGFNDQTAIVWIQEQRGQYCVLAAYESRGKPAAFYTSIIKGEPDMMLWKYTDRDLEFMEWTASLPKDYLRNGRFYGDVSGHSIKGATMDSEYTIFRKNGIIVNADRTQSGDLVGYRKEARTHKGRQEALREILPNMKFSNERNAPYALGCLQDNKYPAETGRARTESQGAVHDDTSHVVTALEYFAVHRKLAHSMDAMSERRKKKKQDENKRDWSVKHDIDRRWIRADRLPGTR